MGEVLARLETVILRGRGLLVPVDVVLADREAS